jgi:hypothetical protein
MFAFTARASTAITQPAASAFAADTAHARVPCAALHRTNATSPCSLPVTFQLPQDAPEFQPISVRTGFGAFDFILKLHCHFLFQSSIGCARNSSCSLRLSCGPIKAMSETDTLSVPHSASLSSASGILLFDFFIFFFTLFDKHINDIVTYSFCLDN